MKAKDIIKKYSLDKNTWTNKGFHGVLHPFFPVAETPILPFRKQFGDSHTIAIVFFKEDVGNWYWNDADMERLRDLFIYRAQKDKNYLKNYLALWHQLLEKFIVTYKKLNIDFERLEDRKLLDLYKEFYEAYIEQYGIAIGVQDAFSMHADRFFVPLIREVMKKCGEEEKTEGVFAQLTAPLNESFLTIEYKERLHILAAIRKDSHLVELFTGEKEEIIPRINASAKLTKMFEQHSKKWFWIENNYAIQKVLTKENFIEKIVQEFHLKTNPKEEIKEIERRIPEAKKVKERLIKELKLNDHIRLLVKITELFAYMQDERKKYVLISNHYQRRFFEEIGQRVGLTTKEMEYTVFPEMEDILLCHTFDRKKLALRHKHCLCIWTLKGYEIFEGDEVNKVFDRVFRPKVISGELRGMCASHGKAKGIVKIVRKVDELGIVENGDILVASMTRPEMVVAMEKAAAIVTDEGGITSHAAIVSRELGIPCIVGTRIATSVLKTGDIVEVDAFKGTVRKVR